MKFSIITCTHNSAAYLQKNIDSVKNQSFRDFEHIFIDGFSSDGTKEIIKQYQKASLKRVKLFQFEPRGIANAMNRGIEKSGGKYLIHLHSDDSFYNNDILKKVSNFIEEKNNPDFIYGKAKFVSDDGSSRIIPHRKIYQKLRHWLLFLTNYIPHQATFIKKTIFEKYGTFDEQYKNSMDYEMWLRLSKNKVSNRFIDEIICNFSAREGSQSSRNKNNCLKENLMIINKYIKNEPAQKLLASITKINFLRN